VWRCGLGKRESETSANRRKMDPWEDDNDLRDTVVVEKERRQTFRTKKK
jgi:hypothetical protein